MSPFVDTHSHNEVNTQVNPIFNNNNTITNNNTIVVEGPEPHGDVILPVLQYAICAFLIVLTFRYGLKSYKQAKRMCCKKNKSKRGRAAAVVSPTSRRDVRDSSAASDDIPRTLMGASEDAGEGIAAEARPDDAATMTDIPPAGAPQAHLPLSEPADDDAPTTAAPAIPAPVAPVAATTSRRCFYRIPRVVRWAMVITVGVCVYLILTYDLPIRSMIGDFITALLCRFVPENASVFSVVTFFTSTVPYWRDCAWYYMGQIGNIRTFAQWFVFPVLNWLFEGMPMIVAFFA